MTDVYAKMGIPMPESEGAPEDTEILENVAANPTPAIDWAKREEEERDRQLRLECLRLIDGVRHDKVVTEAEKLFTYVKAGLTDPITRYTFVCGTCPYEESLENKHQLEDNLKEHMRRAHSDLYQKFYV